MAILPIIIAPDPLLKTRCDPVDKVTPAIETLLNDMLETMYDAPGIGLAAPQIGITKRLLVVDVAKDSADPQPMKIINPEILWQSEELAVYEEGCLSFPQQYAEVSRPKEVKIQYLNEKGERQQIHASGLLATCIQHEIDHVDGIVFVDHLSALKRSMILRRLKKQRKHGEV